MKASELLTKIKAGESISCDTCDEQIPADEILKIAFRRGELAPKMENVNVGSVVCVECQKNDELIKVDPCGPDVKFRHGD